MAKSSLRVLIAVVLVHPQSLWANPAGGTVAAGAADISSSGGTLTVLQASQNAVIDWSSFSIAQGELTRFVQPSAASAVLNRVTGGDPSAIYGALQANGRVFLINPNGVTVGPTGVIDTRSFVASTLDLDDEAFMAGGPLRFAGGSQAGLINMGRINALGGDVLLIAHTVRNTGAISAPQGTVGLAAASEVLLQPDGDERVFVQAGGGEDAAVGVDQAGRIEAATAELKAAGGNIYSLAINHSGVIQATGVERRGGRVYLVAEDGDIAVKSGSAVAATGDVRLSANDGNGKIFLDAGIGTAGGGQTYNGEVVLGGDVALNTGGGRLLFRGTVDSAPGGARSLTLDSGAGDVQFDGFVGLGAPLSSLHISGEESARTLINGGAVTTEGAQHYGEAVVLGGLGTDTQLASGGGGVAFDRTVDGGKNLLVGSGAGDVRFSGQVGGGSPLRALYIDGDGTTRIDGGRVTTEGKQRYNEAVVLGGAGADAVLTSASEGVEFRSTVDGGKNLIIDSGAGDTEFDGYVGLAAPLDSLDIASEAIGRTLLDGGGVTTVGAQHYGEAVILGGPGTDTHLASGGGGVAFGRAVDGEKNLLIGTGAGGVTFSGAVGAEAPPRSLSVDGDGIAHIDGGLVATAGKQRYGEAVVLGGAGADAVLTSGGEGVEFGDTVDGGRNLAIDSGAGDVEFDGFVGLGTALASLDITGRATARTLINGGAVTTAGAQHYGEAVILGGQGTDTQLASGGGAAFDRAVDGEKNLLIGTGAGDATFLGAVGGDAPLRALYIDGEGSVHLDGGLVATRGKQRFGEAVVLDGWGAVLSSESEGVDFARTVDGGGNLLIDSGAGDVLFAGAAGGKEALGLLRINGAESARTIIEGGAVTTAGAQRYGEAVILGGPGPDTRLTSAGGGVTFGRAVDGEKNLRVASGAGDVEFAGFVGLDAPLASLDITGEAAARTRIDGGAVTTGGAQHYGEAVLLGGPGTDTQLASAGGGVVFDREVDGGKNLLIGSGAGGAAFSGAVGGGAPLRALYIDGDGTTHIDGGKVTTAGKQRYGEAVVLGGAGADAVLTSAGEGVEFAGSVDGARNLIVASGEGDVLFAGAVGGGEALSSLDITGAARTLIDGGAVMTDGAQRYGEKTSLGADAVLTSRAGDVVFGAGVDAEGDLTVAAAGNAAWDAALAARDLRVFGKDILMGGDVTASGPGGVLMVAGASFKNAASHSIATADGSRFLVYSVSPGRDALGGLTGAVQFGTSYANGPRPGFAGSGFLYSDPERVPPSLALESGAVFAVRDPLFGWLPGGVTKPGDDEAAEGADDDWSASPSDIFSWELGTLRDAVASSNEPERKKKKRK